jgi:hypothetical protein
VGFTPFTIFIPPPHSRNTSNKFHCSISYMYTKYIYSIHPTSPSLITLPPSTGTHPQTGPLPSCPSFLMYMLIIQWCLAMIFYTCMYCALIRLMPSITPFLCHPAPYSTAFSAFHYAVFIQDHALLFSFSLSLSLSPFPPLSVPLSI